MSRIVPELDYALLGDYVRPDASGVAHVIGAGIDTIPMREVPAGHNIGLLFRVEFTRQECGRPHRLEVVFQDIDGERLLHITSVITPDWIDDLPVGWNRGWLGGFNFGVPLPRFGVYSFEFLINDTNKKTLHLRVVPSGEDAAPEGDEVAPAD